MPLTHVALLSLLIGCPGEEPDTDTQDTEDTEIIDADGDGWEQSEDCDDTDANTFPGSTYEQPYDGIDSDCGADDDFDFDEDGHVPPASWLTANNFATYSGSLPQDDCDDTSTDTHPGTSTTDVPYDGIDHDCDGANDYDKDGDTYMPDGFELELTAFEQKYAYSFPANWSDCDDDDPGIYPTATDTWYDGIDSDCGAEDDHDRDEDGVVPAPGDLPVGSVPYTGSLPDGDCDDTDAAVHPGALERIGDIADQDCDGQIDTGAFGFSRFLFDTPRRPAVGATDHSYLVTIAADRFIDATIKSEWAGTFSFALAEATADAYPGQEYCFEGCGQSYTLGEALDMHVEADRFYVATSYVRLVTTPEGSVDKNYIRFHRYEWSALIGQYSNAQPLFSPVETTDPYLDIDIEPADNGDFVAVACGQNTVHYLSAFNDAANNGKWTTSGYAGRDYTAPDAGHACYVQPRSGDTPLAHVFDWQSGDGKSTYELLSVDLATATDASWSTMDVYDVNQRDGLLVFTGGDTANSAGLSGVTVDDGTTTDTFLAGETVYSADAMIAPDGTLYLVAVVADRGSDGWNDLVLLYGDPSVAMTERIVPFAHPTLSLEPDGASIFVDANRVLIGVSGLDTTGTGDDGVGWLFLGFP